MGHQASKLPGAAAHKAAQATAESRTVGSVKAGSVTPPPTVPSAPAPSHAEVASVISTVVTATHVPVSVPLPMPARKATLDDFIMLKVLMRVIFKGEICTSS